MFAKQHYEAIANALKTTKPEPPTDNYTYGGIEQQSVCHHHQ